MQLVTTSNEIRKLVAEQRNGHRSVGLVPTMGNLHAGHLKLVTEARAHCDFVVSTVFVNPLQFGPTEDLDAYPRTLDADRALLEQQGCDVLFAPSVEEIFGPSLQQQTVIHVPQISENYCGASRPGHFDGVATIVCKLFNLVGPNKAFFGLKDYQQFLVIKKMVTDLAIPVEIEGIETVREDSGLAMSSRNGYLSDEQKESAASIYQCLKTTAIALRHGNRNFTNLESEATDYLRGAGLKPDYYAICEADTLRPAGPDDKSLVILAAAYIGPSRLIDNLRLDL